MSKTIHRQIGRFQTRSADDADVAMIIKEVDDMELFLGKLVEHTKAWRDAWSDILHVQTRIADSFHDVYMTIPRTGDAVVPPEPTPPRLLRRVELLHTSHNELMGDMLMEVEKVDTMLVKPMGDCLAVLKPLRRAIEKREHKKLDFDRFSKSHETAKAKKNKTEKDYAAVARHEADLEKAKLAYGQADDYIRENVPPLLAKIIEFLPLAVEIAIQVQYTLLQHSYSQLFHYASEQGFADSEFEVVLTEWEDLFLPIKQQVETDLRMIAKGKAIMMPMNFIPSGGVLSKVPRNPLTRTKTAPPPPPPAASAANGGSPPAGRGREDSRLGIGKQRSSASISSRASREESPPPPLPGARPTIGGGPRIGKVERDESPPPQNKIGSYGSQYGSGSVTPTPLAGLKPSSLVGPRRNSMNSAPTLQMPSPASSSSSLRIGRALTPVSGRSPSPSSMLAPSVRSSANRSPSPSSMLAPSVRSSADRSPSPSSGHSLASVAAKKKKPPPPPPKKKFGGQKEVWVKAVFSFEGQDHGDLSFYEGDRIKVLKKTDSTDDWWEGECNGQKGQFPANYCELTT